jgi:transposase
VNIAEKIYETVKTLPEQTACEVLYFAESLKAKQAEEMRKRRENALDTLTKYRGRFKADKFVREDCYDR